MATPTSLTNRKRAAVAQVPKTGADSSPVAGGSGTLRPKGDVLGGGVCSPFPRQPADPQDTAPILSSPAGSGVCPAGKGVRRSRHWRDSPPPMLESLYPPWPLTPAISGPFKMSLLGPRRGSRSPLVASHRSQGGGARASGECSSR